MIKRVHHIGIAVKDLKESIPLFESLLGVKPRLEEAPSQKVNEAIFRVGEGMEIDLMEPTGPDSTVAKFLETRGEGLHHIALEVDDINKELKAMEKKGFRIIGNVSGEGVAGQTGFLHPKSVNGVLVELLQLREGGE
ncbi:MAG TPA: methylmalonyl-CoA epimerase [Dehalococcoidia bacterium]|nr:methylmalonyl-CoA epimerase [Dehalococcoidia bacterium]